MQLFVTISLPLSKKTKKVTKPKIVTSDEFKKEILFQLSRIEKSPLCLFKICELSGKSMFLYGFEPKTMFGKKFHLEYGATACSQSSHLILYFLKECIDLYLKAQLEKLIGEKFNVYQTNSAKNYKSLKTGKEFALTEFANHGKGGAYKTSIRGLGIIVREDLPGGEYPYTMTYEIEKKLINEKY